MIIVVVVNAGIAIIYWCGHIIFVQYFNWLTSSVLIHSIKFRCWRIFFIFKVFPIKYKRNHHCSKLIKLPSCKLDSYWILMNQSSHNINFLSNKHRSQAVRIPIGNFVHHHHGVAFQAEFLKISSLGKENLATSPDSS